MTALRVLAALSMLTASAGAALAQSKTLITHFTPSTVVKALTDLGATDATVKKTALDGGKSVDVVYFSNGGLKHVAILTVCGQKGCQGLQLMTIWGESAGKTVSRTALNTYNANFGFGKGFIAPGNTLAYARYTISDGGVSIDNLKANVSNFLAGSTAFLQFIAKSGAGTEASLLPGGGAAEIYPAAHNLAPEAQAVLMEMGQGAGLNALSIQSAPIPDAPALIKPAQ